MLPDNLLITDANEKSIMSYIMNMSSKSAERGLAPLADGTALVHFEYTVPECLAYLAYTDSHCSLCGDCGLYCTPAGHLTAIRPQTASEQLPSKGTKAIRNCS